MSFLRENRTQALVCLLVALAATALRAQQKILWQGAVKPSLVNVHSQPSTNDRALRTLGRGEIVNVVLEIRVHGDAWCRVEFPGETEPIGFVLCMNLQQGNFASQEKTRSESVTTQTRSLTTGTATTGQLQRDRLKFPRIVQL